MVDTLWKQKNKNGFISYTSDHHGKTVTGLAPDLNNRWQVMRELLGPEWRWYDEKYSEIEYKIDKNGFRNSIEPEDIEEGYILQAGQSVVECIGLPWEDTSTQKIMDATGKQVYQVAVSGIDVPTIRDNIIAALKTMPKPSHIIVWLTNLKSEMMTYHRAGTDDYFNVMPLYGKIKEFMVKKYGINNDWMTQALDVHRACTRGSNFHEQLHWQAVKHIEDICSILDIPLTVCDCEMDNRIFDKDAEIGVTLDGHWVRFMNLFPVGDEMDKLLSLNEMQDLALIEQYPIEWLNTRARDLVHNGPEVSTLCVEHLVERINRCLKP